jgi:AcrR family transcriptional regulator
METTLEPRKSPRQDRSARMVDDLLRATARVLVEEGWDAASTNRIAKVAGVSVGSLYQYFPNRDALVMAVARQHAARMLALLQAAAPTPDGSLEDIVAGLVRAMFVAHRSEPALHRALTQQLFHVGLGPYADTQDAARGLVRLLLERHRARLVVTDLDTAAWICVTTTEATIHAALLEGRVDDLAIERELCAMLARYLVG